MGDELLFHNPIREDLPTIRSEARNLRPSKAYFPE